MAVALIFRAEGVTQAQYEQVRQAVMPDNKLLPGMLAHAGGPSADGWRVVEIWESQEALDRFFQEKLGAALQQAKINVQPEVFPVHNLVTS
jgi:quinol monooxygenase YgiN